MPRRVALVAAALACNPPAAGGDPIAAPPRAPSPPPPACDEPPAGALAYLSDRTCPSVIYQDNTAGLALRSLTPGARAVSVLPPEACKPCRFSGAVTPAGPLVLAVRTPAGSELADAAWLGATAEGEPLTFTPLWYDRPVLGDSTVQGPAYALAPFVCGATLVLWPAPRLPGARGEEPSPELLAASGVYAPRRGELVRLGDPVPADRSACTPVPLELP